MHGCGADLLRAAQRAGRVRPDLTAGDLFDLLTAAGWVRENSGPGRDAGARVLELMLAGVVLDDPAAGPR
jgi:hypothetical protein